MTKNLLIINVLAFVATLVLERSGVDLTSMLGLHFSWPVTSGFISSSPICFCMEGLHIFFSICLPSGCLVV